MSLLPATNTRVFVEPLEDRRLMSGSSTRVVLAPVADTAVGQIIDQRLGWLKADSADAFGLRVPTATINWGDHTGKTVVPTVYNGSAGGFEVSGSHVYTSEGDFKVSIVFRRGSRVLGRLRDVVDVYYIPGVQKLNATVDVPLSGTVGTFTRGRYPATDPIVDWGDGTQSPAELTMLNRQTYRVSATHTYTTAGTYPLTVTAYYTWSPAPAGEVAIGAPPSRADVIGGTVTVVEPPEG